MSSGCNLSRSEEEKDTPLELWAARSLFGMHHNDGQEHPGVTLNADKTLPGYADQREEIKAWYEAFFAPVELNKDQVKQLLKPTDAPARDWQTQWKEDDNVEFAILLPCFVIGQSSWHGHLEYSGYERKENVWVHANVDGLACYPVTEGLLVDVTWKASYYYRALRYSVFYQPKQGLERDTESKAAFVLANRNPHFGASQGV